jgi:hypothetical protein
MVRYRKVPYRTVPSYRYRTVRYGIATGAVDILYKSSRATAAVLKTMSRKTFKYFLLRQSYVLQGSRAGKVRKKCRVS